MKPLPDGVLAEELQESQQKLVFNLQDVPVDLLRLLALKGATELHEELAARVLALPPSPYGWIAEDVYELVKQEFGLRFWQKELGIYVCSRMETLVYEGIDTGFQYFTWVEFVDITVNQN